MKFLIIVFVIVSSFVYAETNYLEIEEGLKGQGVEGEIHGANVSSHLFVFTVRNPENFFDHFEFPLIPASESVREDLAKLHRHDRVNVKGHFVQNGAPIRHIMVNKITVIRPFESVVGGAPYQYEANVPSELIGKRELIGKVHAVANEGKILVIEYQDIVVPVYVEDASWTKSLYRNDKIRIKYVIRDWPPQPTHLVLDTKDDVPLEVLDAMVSWHGKAGSVEGFLVLFEKSPQVNFNVFALQVRDQDGVRREFTLVNFEDPKVFEGIRRKLQEWWDLEPSGISNARNKFINRKVRVRAEGSFNVVDSGQANPQVLLRDANSLLLLK